jgi:hypothetical protein
MNSDEDAVEHLKNFASTPQVWMKARIVQEDGTEMLVVNADAIGVNVQNTMNCVKKYREEV